MWTKREEFPKGHLIRRREYEHQGKVDISVNLNVWRKSPPSSRVSVSMYLPSARCPDEAEAEAIAQERIKLLPDLLRMLAEADERGRASVIPTNLTEATGHGRC